MRKLMGGVCLSVGALLGPVGSAWAADPLLAPGAMVLGIDTDDVFTSSYPAAEDPPKAFDSNTGTKYLNFGQKNSGVIITPAGGSSIVQSFRLTTANDAEGRDPSSFSLFGTNDPIASTNNSWGNGENWTPIAGGALTLPAARLTAGDVVSFANATAWNAYRIIFPSIKDAGQNSMQVSEIGLFASNDGSGANVLAGSSYLAIDTDHSASSYPGAEGPGNLFDGAANTKYLNRAGVNSGLIVTPNQPDKTIVTGIQFSSANDDARRDPTSWALYGTNDPITSENNSLGNAENWTLITTGDAGLPDTRLAQGPMIDIVNGAAFTSYRLVFTGLKDSATQGLMQLGDVQLFGSVVPEPATLGLFAIGALLVRVRRSRK